MPSESINTASLNSNGSNNECATSSTNAVRKISYDPTEYVQKARVTKAAPPPPAYNPLQFVAVKPVKLYKTAEQQLKKMEEVKITKEVKKEDAEEWQSNLDNWKCSRRKRVEHIIDRVVEVKKLELEEHDRNRRKSKTFSEMMEERGGRRKISVPIYQDDDGNDFSDLGISTSSTSGKSSLSEDYDNQSVTSDSVEEKSIRHNKVGEENMSKSISSDYAASTESQDIGEYTYEAAIENYKSRVMRVASSSSQIEEKSIVGRVSNRNRSEGSKIEDRLLSMEMKLNSNDTYDKEPLVKADLPKVNIAKRRELFENGEKNRGDINEKPIKSPSTEMPQIKSIKQRMSDFKSEEHESREERHSTFNIDVNISSVKGRFLILEKNVNSEPVEKVNKVEVPLSVSLKDRLSSLQSCVDSSKNAKVNSISNKEKVTSLSNGSQNRSNYEEILLKKNQIPILEVNNVETIDTDREDSGIHTTDVSCSVSQADEQNEERFDELNSVNIEANNRIEETAERNVIEVEVEKSQNSTEIEVRTEKFDEVTTTAPQNLSMPDLIQHNNISLPNEDIEPATVEHQDENVIEALEIAFQEIDNESTSNPRRSISHLKNESPKIVTDFEELQAEIDPFYENIDEILEEKVSEKKNKKEEIPKRKAKVSPPIVAPKNQKEQVTFESANEPYYQTPNAEPYYEVPKTKTKPVPLYENVQLRSPPRQKPPPPPVPNADEDDEEQQEQVNSSANNEDNFKRINSTKRIKKELWNKRSSFLGIEGTENNVFELNVAPPPDLSAFLEEERRLQRQLIMKTGFSDNSDTGESRDSGVSENHSRQSSGPFSVEEQTETTMKMPQSTRPHQMTLDDETRLKNIEKQIFEQENRYHINRPNYDEDTLDAEEVLRVERELLQLEREELNRQRSNLMQRELDHGDNMLMSGQNYVNPLNSSYHHQAYQVETEYRKSMPDLQTMMEQQKRLALNAPAKPLRSQFQQEYLNANPLLGFDQNSSVDTNLDRVHQNLIPQNDFVHLRKHHERPARPNTMDESNIYANMSKHTLHAISATPKPRLTNDWVQHPRAEQIHTDFNKQYQNTNIKGQMSEWAPHSSQNHHQKRKSEPQAYNYQNHWLIQEAEQRRLDQQRGVRNVSKKPLPDSVIQTITQRVQSMGIGERRRSAHEPNFSVSNSDLSQSLQQDPNERVLSVSGKKKCTHCNNELGRGAAMIIESLRLFYHIDCFKCFVCHTPLGDGLGGTDVRVRNSKLHCQNCYSSDDGVKFSCV